MSGMSGFYDIEETVFASPLTTIRLTTDFDLLPFVRFR